MPVSVLLGLLLIVVRMQHAYLASLLRIKTDVAFRVRILFTWIA